MRLLYICLIKPTNTMKNPRDIEKVNNWNFIVPTYKITNNGVEDATPHVINLCRGDANNENSPRQTGLFTETLLQVAVLL